MAKYEVGKRRDRRQIDRNHALENEAQEKRKNKRRYTCGRGNSGNDEAAETSNRQKESGVLNAEEVTLGKNANYCGSVHKTHKSAFYHSRQATPATKFRPKAKSGGGAHAPAA